MFSIERNFSNGHKTITLRNNSTGESFSVITTLGACLKKLVLSRKGRNYSVLKNPELINQFIQSYTLKFNGAKLFSYPNRVKYGKYSFAGKDFKLNQNDGTPFKHALHGIIYNQVFSEKEALHGENFCSVVLQYTNVDEGFFQGYPFKFELIIKYTLSNNGLKATTFVNNLSEAIMPFGDGWHPYFSIGGSIDDLYLSVPSDKILELGDDLIPTGKLRKYPFFNGLNKIGNSILNHSFFIETSENVVETILYNAIDDFKLVLWQENNVDKYKYLQVYIPPDRQSIALEPMTCAPNAFNNNMGLQWLYPGEQYSCQFGIKIVD